MELTKKSKEELFGCDNGRGALSVKTRYGVITEIEFYLARNGKFCTMNGTLLTERLNELSREIEEE